MWTHDLPHDTLTPGDRRLRDLAAVLLRIASHTLGLLAERLAPRARAALVDPVLEFHADAGAPEGALYVNGQLVGHVLGVTRL